MNKVTNFVKQTLAMITGDEKTVISTKNERKSNSAINGQLAALKSKLVDDESALEDAEELLKNAKFPSSLITDNPCYIESIKRANSRVQSAKNTIADTKYSIEFFESILAEYNEQVDA